MTIMKNQWNFFNQSAMFIGTGCSSVWWSTAFGTLGPLVQVQSSRFFYLPGLASPPQRAKPVEPPPRAQEWASTSEGLPNMFLFFLDVTDYASPITVFEFWGLRL